VEGSCEHGNEPAGSINCCEILELVAQLAASKEGFKPNESVSWILSFNQLYFISWNLNLIEFILVMCP
jgi:hypothetical protein